MGGSWHYAANSLSEIVKPLYVSTSSDPKHNFMAARIPAVDNTTNIAEYEITRTTYRLFLKESLNFPVLRELL